MGLWGALLDNIDVPKLKHTIDYTFILDFDTEKCSLVRHCLRLFESENTFAARTQRLPFHEPLDLHSCSRRPSGLQELTRTCSLDKPMGVVKCSLTKALEGAGQ